MNIYPDINMEELSRWEDTTEDLLNFHALSRPTPTIKRKKDSKKLKHT